MGSSLCGSENPTIPYLRPRLSSSSLCPLARVPLTDLGSVWRTCRPRESGPSSTAQNCWECACLPGADAAVVQTSRHGPSHRQQLALQRCSQEGGGGWAP